MSRRVAALVALAGCGTDPVFVQPVYDLPIDDLEATATNLDTLTLSVARPGQGADLVAQSFAPTADSSLGGVPFDTELVLHLAGRLDGSDVAYGRTCTFSIKRSGPPPTPHLFFARNVRFASLVFSSGRTSGMAVSDALGGAVLFGGSDANGPLLDIDRFDPNTGELRRIAVSTAPRIGAVGALLGVGQIAQVVIVGGTAATSLRLIDVDGSGEEVADPDLAVARTGHTVTALTDGRVAAIAGRTDAGMVTGTIAVIAKNAGAVELRKLSASLMVPRADHTATRLGDDVGAPVLIVGGVDAAGAPILQAELFKPLSGDLANPATFDRKMVVARSRHVARLMPDGSVLFIGGVDNLGQPVLTLERFTIDAGFVAAGKLPDGAAVIDLSATTLPDGRVLLAGGRATIGGPPTRDALIARVDVVNGAVDVVGTDRLAVERAGHQAALLCDGTVLITGGTATNSVLERYNPPALGRR